MKQLAQQINTARAAQHTRQYTCKNRQQMLFQFSNLQSSPAILRDGLSLILGRDLLEIVINLLQGIF